MPRPPLPKLDCKFGAPMGRGSYWPGCAWNGDKAVPCMTIKLYLHRLPFVDGCYDQGGAYWGSPADVYRAIDEADTFCIYLRARNRKEAKEQLRDKFPEFNLTFFN